jgi:hypothetical protein
VVAGHEAAAHGGDVTSLVLIPSIASKVDLPIIAAGGFADGRGEALGSTRWWIRLSLGGDNLHIVHSRREDDTMTPPPAPPLPPPTAPPRPLAACACRAVGGAVAGRGRGGHGVAVRRVEGVGPARGGQAGRGGRHRGRHALQQEHRRALRSCTAHARLTQGRQEGG